MVFNHKVKNKNNYYNKIVFISADTVTNSVFNEQSMLN